jgi:hypothetical protein
MVMHDKTGKLMLLYDRFEEDIAEYMKQAVCRQGCTFCCTSMGKVDAVTLEGLIIHERISSMPETLRIRTQRGLERDKRAREKGKKCRCPFLDDKGSCMIYDVRPFSCRQLYSVRMCGSTGPMVHRQANAAAKGTVMQIQKLDDTGYSGHLSFIMKLLDDPAFKVLYVSGGFAPERFSKYARKHGIVINRLS